MFDNVFILHIVIAFLLMHIFTRLYTICVFIICSAYSANIIYFNFLTHVTIRVCCDACIYMVYTLVHAHFLVNEFYIYFTQFTNYVHFTNYILNVYFTHLLIMFILLIIFQIFILPVFHTSQKRLAVFTPKSRLKVLSERILDYSVKIHFRGIWRVQKGIYDPDKTKSSLLYSKELRNAIVSDMRQSDTPMRSHRLLCIPDSMFFGYTSVPFLQLSL